MRFGRPLRFLVAPARAQGSAQSVLDCTAPTLDRPRAGGDGDTARRAGDADAGGASGGCRAAVGEAEVVALCAHRLRRRKARGVYTHTHTQMR